MAKGLIDTILDSVFDDEWIGRRGEKLTERELKLVNLFGRRGKTLRNLYVPKESGETSEIDLVYITQKGVFVFESKNYSGWIFGDEASSYWTASLPNGQKNRFYNPVKQNKTHLKWLRKYIGEDIPLFSIVVFSERCELKKVTVESKDVQVIQRDRTYGTVRKIWDSHADVLSAAETDELYEKLKPLTNADEEKRTEHVEHIKERYSGPKAKGPTPQTAQFVCPRCGKALVLRTAKKGVNAGKQFYGCSGFPNCRYMREIDFQEKG